MHLSGFTIGWSSISCHFICPYVSKQADQEYFAAQQVSGVCQLRVQMVGLNEYELCLL